MGSNQPLTVAATTTGQEAEDTYDSQHSPIQMCVLTRVVDAVGQGVWVRLVNNVHVYNGNLYNASNADGDNFTVNFRCMTGTWTLRFNASKSTNRCIIDVDLDGGEVGSFDLYAVALDKVNVEEVAGLAITGGTHTLRFRADGQNGASTGFTFVCNVGISLQRTA